MRRWLLWFHLCSFLALMMAPGPEAEAHSQVRALKLLEAPSPGSQRRLILTLSSPIESKFSQFSLQGKGRVLPLTPLNSFGERSRQLLFEVDPLLKGSFTFQWSVLSVDGHRQKGIRPLHLN